MVSCFLYIPDTLYLSLSLSPKVRAIQNRAGLFIHSGGGVVLGVVVVVLFGQKSQKVKSGGGSFSLSLSLRSAALISLRRSEREGKEGAANKKFQVDVCY